MKTNVAKNAEPSKSRKFFTYLWNETKDFFNPKEWLKTLRSVPSLALALITVATVLMNILANKSIINLPWLIQDAGILMSWVGFLVGDLLVKAFGSKNAIRVNLTCLGISLFISGLLAIVAIVPGDWSPVFDPTINPGDIGENINASVNSVMGNVWYVILGSAVASAVGLVVNGLTQGLLIKKIEAKHGDKYWGFFVASASSTMIGQILDNMVFAALVSVKFFGWTWHQVLVCSLCGAIVELVVELVFSPLTYKISKNWKKNGIGTEWIKADKDKIEVAA
mgnify:CR=1 FL=1